MKVLFSLTVVLGLTTPMTYAQSCCAGGNSGTHTGCAMGTAASGASCPGRNATQTSSPATPSVKVFAEPVQSVYDQYIEVQNALAGDSLKGVSTAANAMVKAVQADSAKSLAPKVVEQAEALSKAKDLAGARDAFKDLSETLIQHLSAQKSTAGVYRVAYCPMAKASWIQMGKAVINPYMGPSMVHCGQFKS